MGEGAFEAGDSRIGELGFPAWTDVRHRNSIADLIFAKSDRCGIYVLGFTNGERYVGLSIDVVKRFGQHRLVHADIDLFTFQKVAEKDLPRVERACIHALEAHGIPLRNLDHMSVVKGERDLDLVVAPQEQQQWLDRTSIPELAGRQVDDPDLRRRYRRRFEQFVELPHAEEALFLLGAYIASVIPFPRRTELSFWSVSCMPGNGRHGLYARVNLNMQEVLTVQADHLGLAAHFHLARSPFESYFGGAWQEILEEDDWVVDLHGYKPDGHDQFWMKDNDPESAKELIVWRVPSDAMSKLNMNLMRRGPNYYSSSHSLDLVDAAFAIFEQRKHELIPIHEQMPEGERSRQRWM